MNTESVFGPVPVERADRLSRGGTLWFTGLSGSGKSTVGTNLERALLAEGHPTYVLDGDNVRQGLNRDLGYSMHDRMENLRRIAHVAVMLADAGLLVVVPVISPLQRHRDEAREIHREAGLEFFEVHFDIPVEICERRDPKGLYAKARDGQIRDFTGIDSPYEPPLSPDVRIGPEMNPESSVAALREVILSIVRKRS